MQNEQVLNDEKKSILYTVFKNLSYSSKKISLNFF